MGHNNSLSYMICYSFHFERITGTETENRDRLLNKAETNTVGIRFMLSSISLLI